jgi:hypothetical protein
MVTKVRRLYSHFDNTHSDTHTHIHTGKDDTMPKKKQTIRTESEPTTESGAVAKHLDAQLVEDVVLPHPFLFTFLYFVVCLLSLECSLSLPLFLPFRSVIAPFLYISLPLLPGHEG